MDLLTTISILSARVETRMKISIMTSTGDDNPISDDKGDLQYRKEQLKRLQEEVVDFRGNVRRDFYNGSWSEREFRMDLVSYIKENPNLDQPLRASCHLFLQVVQTCLQVLFCPEECKHRDQCQESEQNSSILSGVYS